MEETTREDAREASATGAGAGQGSAQGASEARRASRRPARRGKAPSRLQRARRAMPVVVMCLVGVGFLTTWGLGTLSGLGWGDLAALCPLGSLATMLATKAAVPRVLVSLGIAAVLMLLLGRAFCGWVCPVPAVARLRSLFGRGGRKVPARAGAREGAVAADAVAGPAPGVGDAAGSPQASPALTDDDRRAIRRAVRGGCAGHARQVRGALDSRHVVLAGALAATAAFGFPVFCLVCPVGLTFAMILLVIRAFTAGDVSVALVAVPLVLVCEVVLFRRWCHTFCPLGALMGLAGRLGRTLRPSIDDARCVETAKGRACGACARVCGEGIDLRHPERGVSVGECVRCGRCVEACPAKAVSVKLMTKVTK